MSFALIQKVNEKQKKHAVVDVRSGDTVRVSQRIKEGNKERVQVFVGVEKSFLVHSPLVEKIEIVRRAKVRRKFLSFLRERSGKSARLKAVKFNREAVNTLPDRPVSKIEETKESDESNNKEDK